MTTSTEPQRLVFFHDADVVDRSPVALGRLTELMDVTVPAYPGFEGQFDALEHRWESWNCAADLAHHHKAVLHGNDDRPVHVAGAGFGGWVALELALLAQRSMASLVLVAPYGVKLFGPMEREFADVLLLDAAEQIRLGWADPARCTGMRMPDYPAALPDEQREIAFAERATLARYAWKPFLHSQGLSRWLGTIETPTLIIGGRNDGMLCEGHSRVVAEQMPNATYVEIPDAGHYPYLEQADAFFEVVTGFYDQLGGKS